jgi:hypothetical protein
MYFQFNYKATEGYVNDDGTCRTYLQITGRLRFDRTDCASGFSSAEGTMMTDTALDIYYRRDISVKMAPCTDDDTDTTKCTYYTDAGTYDRQFGETIKFRMEILTPGSKGIYILKLYSADFNYLEQSTLMPLTINAETSTVDMYTFATTMTVVSDQVNYFLKVTLESTSTRLLAETEGLMGQYTIGDAFTFSQMLVLALIGIVMIF